MCKERKIPEILICAPCDAVTEEDAEKEYELRKHYKRVFRRGEPKCCTFKSRISEQLKDVLENAGFCIVSEDITGIKVRDPKDDECTISITAKKNS